MSLEVKGTVTAVLDPLEGTSKAGKEWKKQSFVIDTGAQYNPLVCFEVFGEDKIAELIEPISEGQEVTVSFNLSSREWEGKYFHNVQAWKVSPVGGSAPVAAPAPAPSADVTPPGDDDLPF
mgnify:CR=1 FL=1